MNEPPLRPITTRIGGGFSPRLIAVALVGVLATVVLVGLAGRKQPPPQSAFSEASVSVSPTAADRTPSAAPSGSPTLAPRRTPAPTPVLPPGPSIAFGPDAFAVMAVVEDRRYLDVLEEFEPGHFRGYFRLPFPPSNASESSFELAQLWTRGQRRRNYVSIGNWPLPLDPLMRDTQNAGTVIDLSIEPRSNARRAPRLVTRGYRLTVRAESWFDFAIVTVDVQLGPRIGQPAEPEPTR